MKQNGKPIRAGGVITKLCALLFAVITLCRLPTFCRFL